MQIFSGGKFVVLEHLMAHHFRIPEHLNLQISFHGKATTIIAVFFVYIAAKESPACIQYATIYSVNSRSHRMNPCIDSQIVNLEGTWEDHWVISCTKQER